MNEDLSLAKNEARSAISYGSLSLLDGVLTTISSFTSGGLAAKNPSTKGVVVTQGEMTTHLMPF